MPRPAEQPEPFTAYRQRLSGGAKIAEGSALIAERIRQHAGEDADTDDLIDRAYRAGYAQALLDSGVTPRP